MLGLELFVTEDFGIGDHLDEFVGGHGFPELVKEGTVVDADGWGDNLAQTVPVL